MTDSAEDVVDPFRYPWFGITFFLIIWLVAKIVYSLLRTSFGTVSERFMELDVPKRRNVVTYVVEILFTLFSLIAQLYDGRSILFEASDVVMPSNISWMTMSLHTISVLYVWELIYREYFGYPLLIHHLVSLLFIQLVTVTIYESMHVVTYVRLALMIGLMATTEQLSFVALFCYRMDILQQHQSVLFFIAAIQTFVFKMFLFIGCIVTYGTVVYKGHWKNTDWDRFWLYLFIPLLVLLFTAQSYATWILYQLSIKIKSNQVNNDGTIKLEENACTEHTSNISGPIQENPENEYVDNEMQIVFEENGAQCNRGRHRSMVASNLMKSFSKSLTVTDLDEFRESKFSL